MYQEQVGQVQAREEMLDQTIWRAWINAEQLAKDLHHPRCQNKLARNRMLFSHISPINTLDILSFQMENCIFLNKQYQRIKILQKIYIRPRKKHKITYAAQC